MNENNDKLARILDAAAELFASQPFHKVLLSDVARKAAVGKGTLYLYFKSKDELYFKVLFRNFSALIEQIQTFISDARLPADALMAGLIDIMVAYLSKRAIDMGLLGGVMACPISEEWRDKRLQLWEIIENLVRQGIQEGVFEESNPVLTGRYITGMVRSACFFKPESESPESIASHAREFILKALAGK